MIPNILTMIRIILSVSLMFVSLGTPVFTTIYLLCGLSDVLDGFIARKFHCETRIGSMLDSFADAFFLLIMSVRLIPDITWKGYMVLWVIAIGILKLLAYMIMFCRLREVAMLHTYFNKMTGIILFFVPVFYKMSQATVYFVILGSIATVTAIEEIILTCRMKELNTNIRGLY